MRRFQPSTGIYYPNLTFPLLGHVGDSAGGKCGCGQPCVVINGVVYDEDGEPELIVDRLTGEAAVNDDLAPIWVVEIWRDGSDPAGPKNKWCIAADFKKSGNVLPVSLEKAITIAKKRQMMRSDYTYRVRNIKTGAEILAAVL